MDHIVIVIQLPNNAYLLSSSIDFSSLHFCSYVIGEEIPNYKS